MEPQTSAELPAYADVTSPTPSREPVTHSDSLGGEHGGKPFATLNIVSRAASANNQPVGYEGQPIVGSVDLNVEKETAFEAIAVTFAGDLVVGDNLRFTFVEASQQLWSPPLEGRTRSLLDNLLRSPPSAKLQGEFHWPFSLAIPSTVDLPEETGGAVKTYHLPQTFHLPMFQGYIIYRVVLRIKRAGIMAVDHLLFTNVSYFAKSKPPAPSPARQLAYQDNTSLVGPSGDPDGWHTLDSVTVRGTIGNGQPVEAIYTLQLSLAKPLSYTVGSVVPLHLSVRCADPAALELLSTPSAIAVDLLATESMGYDIWPEANMHTTPIDQRIIYLADVKSVPTYRHMSLRLASAVWWDVSSEQKLPTDTRELQGELHVRSTLQPTIHLARFNFSYRVALYPPHIAGFKSEGAKGDKLATVPVDMCAYFADGPRPIVYSPPTYSETHEPELDSLNRFNAMFNLSF
ncbi:hypothetical protein PHLGIDRAFT_14153 [Phlebiopsis gigantea 11061_1 CR5-6]|uniref:Arrestin-like N-terminal domain-containing protein n=1 Tax=Phlebiopsis gigantea (strain 11061_1 CR5-6) TaxID=745531 RepID=A0A0C3NLR7_PHLG1|nr:hypothetical protein PHLGIDRAFT_14153 [Phlebiopsis gigantea 11061_1 CR5-6]